MVGSILISTYTMRMSVFPFRSAAGAHTPDSVTQVLLSGKNQNNHPFTKVDIRLREERTIVTNPTSSEQTLIMDMPKTDYPILMDLLKRTLDVVPGKTKVTSLELQYSSTSHPNEFRVSFIVK